MRKAKKLVCVLVLAAAAGIGAVFAEGPGFSAAAGFGMIMTPLENEQWASKPSIAMNVHYYFTPLTDWIDVGVAGLWNNFWFRDEMRWTDVDGTEKILFAGDKTIIFDLGMILGASLRFDLLGPFALVLDAGAWFNLMFATFYDAGWSIWYGDLDLEYRIVDLGPGVNAALQFDIGRYMLEISVNAGYNLFGGNSWVLLDSDNPDNYENIVDRGDGGKRANALQIVPTLGFGMRY